MTITRRLTMQRHLNMVILFCLMLLGGISVGILDCDYYMNIYCGREILTNGNFYGFSDMTFGSVGNNGFYLDHEWLSSVFFYLLSLTGTYHAIITKVVIIFLYAVAFCFLSDVYEHNIEAYGFVNQTSIFYGVLCFLFSLWFIQIKAYSMGLLFLILIIGLLQRLKETEDVKYYILIGVCLILQNNFHSATYLVTMGILFVAYLTNKNLRNIKTFLWGVLYALSSLINPYGYKLLVFDLSHNGNEVMKQYVSEWRQLSPRFYSFWILLLMILLLSFYFIKGKIRNKNYNILPRLSVSLRVWLIVSGVATFLHARHSIFFALALVVFYLEATNTTLVTIKKEQHKQITSVVLILALCVLLTQSVGIIEKNYRSYENKLEPSLEKVFLTYQDKNIASSLNVNTYYLDIPTFSHPAYPLVAERNEDIILLELSFSEERFNEFVDKYDIAGFYMQTKTHYTKNMLYTSPLINYLEKSDDWVLVYKSKENNHSFYIKKDSLK